MFFLIHSIQNVVGNLYRDFLSYNNFSNIWPLHRSHKQHHTAPQQRSPHTQDRPVNIPQHLLTQQRIPPGRAPVISSSTCWGDFLEESTATIFRGYFQNIRGLPHLQCNALDLSFNLETMKSQQIGLFGRAEPNTNWLNSDTHGEYRSQVSHTL